MVWVPFVVANRRHRSHRRSGAGIILAILIFFLMFGVMFFTFFDWRHEFIPPIWIIFSGFGGFLLIIGICLAITAVTRQAYKRPNDKSLNPYQPDSQIQSKPINPYNIHSREHKQQEQPQRQPIYFNQNIPIVSEINYCRFCGAKIELDAVYCSQCGIKL